jgi:hypothetical protein
MKLSLLFLICALMLGAIGCSSGPPQGVNGNVARAEKEVVKEDGSIIAVSKSATGVKAEARIFPSGEIARVTRITSANGHRRALVEFRDARSAEIKDENEVDRVIEAPLDVVTAAAMKAWDAKNSAGPAAANKAEDAADKATDAVKDADQAAGGGAKRGAEEVRNAASDAAEAAKKGAKKTGKGVKKAGEKMKDSVTP